MLMTEQRSPCKQLHIFEYPHKVKIIIHIDSLVLGNAIGGTRMLSYDNVDSAIQDVKKLSSAMSLKASIHNLNQGGGKCVIYNPGNLDFYEIAPLYTSAINRLAGSFIAANDMGISIKMINDIRHLSPFLISSNQPIDDPSYYTALGVFYCIQYITKNYLETPIPIIKIQGLGRSGAPLCKMLLDLGFKVSAYDINASQIEKFNKHPNFSPLNETNWFSSPCDIFAPCASGNVITTSNVHLINSKFVCGTANNPCENMTVIKTLHSNHIQFIPDFVSNGGGLIYAAGTFHKLSKEDIINKIKNIPNLISTLSCSSSNMYVNALSVANEKISSFVNES